MSNTVNPDQLAGGGNISHIQRPLRTPDELMRVRPDLEMLLLEGQFPIQAYKLKYYDDSEFSGSFDADPYRVQKGETDALPA